jgi:GTP-binding protein Era
MKTGNDPPGKFRSGFVAIAGPPNAGKSTLLNRILGEKLSITSRKPNTTRHRILGVWHGTSAQIVFMDTPGIFQARDGLNLRMVNTAFGVLGDADLILLVVDAARPDANAERFLVKRLKSVRPAVILALNKIDLIRKESLLALIEHWSSMHVFEALVPISATDGTQVDELVETLAAALPQGPPFFPEDMLTDLPQRFLVAETIREKVFRFTGDEIPYAAAVTVDAFKEDPAAGRVTIAATVHVERESQKGIVIGRHGSKLKQIGMAARLEIERMLEARIYLKLFVRVQKNWRKDTRAIRRFGF